MKTGIILAVLLILLGLLLATSFAPSRSHAQTKVGQVIASGSATAKTASVRGQGPVQGKLFSSPPNVPEREREEEKEHPKSNTPIDPSVRPEDIRPTNAETVVKASPETLPRKPAAPQAPGTFTFFRNDIPGNRPTLPGAIPPSGLSPYEPSAGVNGRVVFYTTNNFAAVSGDRGESFSYINPFDNFPADGTLDNTNNGFAGDQYVYYERTRGLMLWLLQYRRDANTNTYRLAVARSQAEVLNNTWAWYDFTPATFSLTNMNGVWLDFPDMAVSNSFLYLTANLYTVTDTPPVALGALVWRIPLDQLAQAANPITSQFFSDASGQTFRLTHGARFTMYWGSHLSNTQIRIYSWADSSGSLAWDDVTHGAYNTGTQTATCAGGTDFASSSDDRILGAWVANGVIGFMWNAAQGGGFARPHVQVVRFNDSNRILLSQGQIFNQNVAFIYPSVHPNDSGHLGGTIAYGCGGGSGSPGLAVWIADDFNNDTITPLESVAVTLGDRAEGRWGDYFATRINVPYGSTWVGTGFVLSEPNIRDHRLVWFGRELRAPPPTNTIYVDKSNTTRYQDGTLFHPYSTVAAGNFACMPGDTMIVQAGNYNERGQFNRAARIVNGPGGYARIGIP